VVRRFIDRGREAGEEALAGTVAWGRRLAGETLDMAGPRPIRVAVTGLSRAGKTVLVTALAHHLTSARDRPSSDPAALAFFDPVKDGRLVEARLEPIRGVPAFPVAENLAALGSSAPEWPARTDAVSGLRIALRYRRPKGWLGRGRAVHARTIELIDYPGEWLLDLALLDRSFADWSRGVLAAMEGEGAPAEARRGLAAEWRRAVAAVDPLRPAADAVLDRLAEAYGRFLRRCRDEAGLTALQPGHLLQPGATPPELMRISPLPPPAGAAPPGSAFAAMERRYDAFVSGVVRPFHRAHFRRFDRQIVLIDVLTALNAGQAAFEDLVATLGIMATIFRYERQGLLGRLTRPRIDRLLFAATKADHITSVQYLNLSNLLRLMVEATAGRIEALGVAMDFLPLAAIKCTVNEEVLMNGQRLSVLSGIPQGERRAKRLYPGEIPARLPTAEDWASRRFRFYDFAPPRLDPARPGGLPHVNLDAALQFLIARDLA